MRPGAVRVVGAALLHRGRCLVAQRSPTMADPGKWELPGGKIEPGEDPATALRREIREELGLEIVVGDWLGRGESSGQDGRIALDVYTAEILSGAVRPAEHSAVRWVGPEELAGLDWAAADRPVLPALRRRLGAADRRLPTARRGAAKEP